jgi:halogenation protein CepH
MTPLFKSSVVRQAMQEGAQVQTRAQLGEYAGAEAPLFEGGLVASVDGLFWEQAEGV